MGCGRVANGEPATPPALLNLNSWLRAAPPLARTEPSGNIRSATGPMSGVLCPMRVAKADAVNGASTLVNSDGRLEVRLDGMPCSACTNSVLVDGWGVAAGGVPVSSVVVPETVGILPRLAELSSLGTSVPDGGRSRLPALS